MATFEAQVKGLTGLSISSSGTTPTQAELTEFLKDGVVDVINKIIQINPSEIPKFCTTTSDDSNSGITVSGKIFSVVREHDSLEVLRPCTPISAQDRYVTNDSTSLKYRSKFNPGYYILDKKIFSVPPSASNNNDLKVTQVHYDRTVTYASDDMQHFPTEYIYLVPMYAAIKALEAKMAEYTITEEDSELVQAISSNIVSLQNSYKQAFGALMPPQPAGKDNNDS